MKKIITVLLIGICNFTYAQTYEDITVQEAKVLIADFQGNEAFTVLDVRTPGEYNVDHLENAYMRNFYDPDFSEQLDILNKNRIYLIYCQSGNRSGQAFTIMQNLGFTEVYNMLGGISSWRADNCPVTTELPPEIDLSANITIPIFEDINIPEAKQLIADQQGNDAFTILDVRTPGEYNADHLENAYMRNFYEMDFSEQLDILNKNRTYLIYCQSGNRSGQAFTIMQTLGFTEVYNMLGGISSWKADGCAVTTELPPAIDLTSNVITSTPQIVTNGAAISVYPNPFTNKLVVDGDLTGYDIIIYNQNEQMIDNLTGLRNPVEIDLSSLPTGLFYLSVQNQNNDLIRFTNIIKQ